MAGRVGGNAAAIPKLPRTMFKELLCLEKITFSHILPRFWQQFLKNTLIYLQPDCSLVYSEFSLDAGS